MASRSFSLAALLLLSLKVVFISMATSSHVGCSTCRGSTKSPPPPPPKSTTPHSPPPPKSKTPTTSGSCPRDALKLTVCADLLKRLLHVVVGTPPTTPCCSLIQGLVDLEAAVCLCTAIKANVLGINLNIPVSLSLLLNTCGKKVPKGFQCA